MERGLGFAVSRYRDLSIVETKSGRMIIACDSIGSVGEKEADSLFAPYEAVGSAAVRVPLMEVIATGASVIAVVNVACCEMEPSARRIISGIASEMQAAGVDLKALNGSTEENFQTKMTAVGVTVIGMEGKVGLKTRNVSPGCKAYLLGLPLVGREVLEMAHDMASYSNLKKIVLQAGVREIVPVGSKGIAYEACALATLNGLTFATKSSSVDMGKSAGPASCLIVAAEPTWVPLASMIEIGAFA
ncbi:MAG: alpha-ribazole-5-phosphate synthase [Eubacteriaceae bacterium]|jgi:hypothetical protein|nr:alpha-ribazole-5-phosphate synthase [Eubacteriaceae bacterium]